MLDLLKRLFLHRKHWDPYYTDSDLSKLPKVDKILDVEEREQAYKFYFRRKEFVEDMMLSTTTAMYPTGSDKPDPRLWLESHWVWFFNKF